jgi:gamma-glutamylcyclotransferase
MADEHDHASRLWYFAYGSNLHRAIFIERRKMQPLDVRWGWLDGYRLCFNIPVGPGERGVANVEPAPGARICGALYQLTATDFDRLDRTEGVHLELYRRVAVEVFTASAERINAFAYQSSVVTDGRKPSPRYIGLLVEGARQHGLPDEWISCLEGLPLAVDEREARGARSSS